MAKKSRTKGASYERELAALLSKRFGITVTRILGQARDSGCDLRLPPFAIEAKRRASLPAHRWMTQCLAACQPGEVPVVMARGDHGDTLVLMRFSDWADLASLMERTP